MDRRTALTLLASASLGVAAHSESSAQAFGPIALEHMEWVGKVLKRMESIQPGMTRSQLLTIFQTEGGISTPLWRTYVSKECGYFKVDVEFQAVGRPDHDADGRETMIEDSEDKIRTISRPYLQFTIAD